MKASTKGQGTIPLGTRQRLNTTRALK